MADELDRIVFSYLKQKGYKEASNALEQASGVQSIDQLVAAGREDVELGVANQIAAFTA